MSRARKKAAAKSPPPKKARVELPRIDEVPLTAIQTKGGTQARSAPNPQVVEEYAEAFREGAPMPPAIVFHDGARYWLADGFHRLEAAEKAQRSHLTCEIRKGTQRDAILHAVGANAHHGLRRTAADKRRAITMLLSDEEWRKWSDREIARRCAVSHPLVAEVRKALTGSTGNVSSRQGADGRAIDTSGIAESNRARATPEKKEPVRVIREPGADVPDDDVVKVLDDEGAPLPDECSKCGKPDAEHAETGECPAEEAPVEVETSGPHEEARCATCKWLVEKCICKERGIDAASMEHVDAIEEVEAEADEHAEQALDDAAKSPGPPDRPTLPPRQDRLMELLNDLLPPVARLLQQAAGHWKTFRQEHEADAEKDLVTGDVFGLLKPVLGTLQHLEEWSSNMRAALPIEETCPFCKLGDGLAKCRQCSGTGLVTRAVYERCPEEFRKPGSKPYVGLDARAVMR